MRPRASTVSTFASSSASDPSSRLRAASTSRTVDTAPSSVSSSPLSPAAPRFRTLDGDDEQPGDALGAGASLPGQPESQPERAPARPGFFSRVSRRSRTSLVGTEVEDGEMGTRSGKKRFGLRSLSSDRLTRLGRDQTLPAPALLSSASTSTSSFLPPHTPGSPRNASQSGSALPSPQMSRQSSASNLAGSGQAAVSPRQRMIRRLSNLPLGRSRASSLSVVSPPGPSTLSSRAPSPQPPAAISARPANRARSASAPLFVNRPVQSMPGVDYFDLLLPRELRLLILSTLVQTCIDDLAAAKQAGAWTGERARLQRWAGRGAGLRELVKASGVSRTWHALAYDSQLWQGLDLAPLGNDIVTTPRLLRMLSSASSLRHLDLTGMADLGPAGVIALADVIASFSPDGYAQNSLQHLNLIGCRSMTSNALHYLLVRSPHLHELRLAGLKAVTNTLFDILAGSVDDLRLLDINRCTNVAGRALLRLVGHHHGLADLRLAGVRFVDDEVLAAIGLAFPSLRQLDLRWTDIGNSGLKVMVARPPASFDLRIDLVETSSGDKRRQTRLRHLALSGCPQLTDAGLDHLAHTLPDLVSLELGNFGERLQAPGLIALLRTTPKLRRLDLDSAVALPDRVLSTLTAHNPLVSHIVLSSCLALTERAILHYVRGFASPGGTLELDGTAANEHAVREAVVRRRAAEVNAIDCRGVGRSVPNEVAAVARPRRGVRGWAWRDVDYHDDDRLGPREMDDARTVLKTFGTLTQLDAADAARETRRERLGEAGTGDSAVKRPRWGRAKSEGCVVS